MASGIKVVRSDGEGCGFWRGFGRYFGMMLSGLILGIGFLMAAFTERKQALHDMICDTVVVDQWAFTAHPDQQREELGTVAWVVLRSEEHTSELQSLMRISYAVFCLKKKTTNTCHSTYNSILGHMTRTT